MKHIFAILVPLCIFCYLGYVVTYAILGTQYSATTTEIVDTAAMQEYSISNDGASVVTDYSLAGEYSNIEINTGGYNVVIKAADTDATNVSIISDYTDKDSFSVEINGDTLCIDSISAGYYGIGSFVEDIAQAIENNDFSQIFSVSTAIVEIPNAIYDTLSADIGSGSVTMTNVSARSEEFDISSGSLIYKGKSDFTADNVALYLSSGKAQAINLKALKYDIDVSSGNFDINGLCGEGSFEMGSGKGTLEYSEYNANGDFTIGSGSLNIIVPNNTNALLTASIGSGVVKVNAAGQSANIKKNGNVTLGNGGAQMDISVGSGKVSIESKNYSITQTAATTVTHAEELAELEGE